MQSRSRNGRLGEELFAVEKKKKIHFLFSLALHAWIKPGSATLIAQSNTKPLPDLVHEFEKHH